MSTATLESTDPATSADAEPEFKPFVPPVPAIGENVLWYRTGEVDTCDPLVATVMKHGQTGKMIGVYVIAFQRHYGAVRHFMDPRLKDGLDLREEGCWKPLEKPEASEHSHAEFELLNTRCQAIEAAAASRCQELADRLAAAEDLAQDALAKLAAVEAHVGGLEGLPERLAEAQAHCAALQAKLDDHIVKHPGKTPASAKSE